jgi:hypothetical protein
MLVMVFSSFERLHGTPTNPIAASAAGLSRGLCKNAARLLQMEQWEK